MAAKTKEMEIIKQVILRHKQGESNRSIAKALSLSKNTVNRYVSLAEADQLSLGDLLKLDGPVLDYRFNGGRPAYTDDRFKDFMGRLPYFEEQMRGPHMTLKLLWEEYRQERPGGYGLSQFRFHYKQNAVALKPRATTVLKDLHEAGGKLYLDFAGDRMGYVDRDSGEAVKVHMFVATLAASDYIFAMAVPSQSTDDFCHAVDCCLQFLGGVPRVLVPDNLKAAVVKADRYSPAINAVFLQLANHYGCCVIPARARHPRDKALVEGAVKLVYQRVFAPLRNTTFHDLESLNEAVLGLVKAYNAKRMQTADFSRQERFAAVDKPALSPLPPTRFEVTRSAQARVMLNGHVLLGADKHYYSVPYEHIGRNVTIRFTRTIVKAFFDGQCIATHPRVQGKGGYTSLDEHLASHCKAYRARSPQYYIERAGRISATFQRLMQILFVGAGAPEVHYNSADGLLRLCRATDAQVFEAACQIAIDRDRCNYPYMRALIKSNLYRPAARTGNDYDMPQHDNIRGAANYQ